MDLKIFLTATQKISVPFAGDTVELEIYTAGPNRLSKEQRMPLLALANDDETTGAESYARTIDYSRLALPLLAKSWDLLWDGAPLPILEVNAMEPIQTAIEKAQGANRVDEVAALTAMAQGGATEVRRYPLPDDLLFAIGTAMREAVAQGPTGESNALSTSEPVATATTSPVADE